MYSLFINLLSEKTWMDSNKLRNEYIKKSIHPSKVWEETEMPFWGRVRKDRFKK